MRIGVDWGGTKIEVAVLNGAKEFVWRKREPTPRHDYEGCIRLVRHLIDCAEDAIGRARSIGVGIPGTISPTSGLVMNANSSWLNGKRLPEDLELALGRPVVFENDANCLALSEAIDGAGSKYDIIFGAILGTGVGGGVVFNKKMLVGAGAIAGEWGHNFMPLAGSDCDVPTRCWCGRMGCIETYISGPGFERDYYLSSGETLSAPEIVKRMRAGEPAARKCFDVYVSRLAASVATVINLIDPDIIVVGGGMSNVGELYELLPDKIPKKVFTDEFNTKIVPAVYGDSSGVRGAAML